MLVYEVNLDINYEIYDRFKTWLGEHVNEMLKFKGFIEGKILQEKGDGDNKKITCCYLLDSQESLDHYLTHHALSMREDGIKKFGDKFRATRRIFDVIEITTPSYDHKYKI